MKKVYFGIALLWFISLSAVTANYFLSYGYQDDKKTIDELNAIQTEIGAYVGKNNKMPGSLNQLKLTNIDINKYEYTYKGVDTQREEYMYELCADFKKEGKEETAPVDTFYIGDNHTAGRYCYNLTQFMPLDSNDEVDPDYDSNGVPK